jgi:hypothetical protein
MPRNGISPARVSKAAAEAQGAAQLRHAALDFVLRFPQCGGLGPQDAVKAASVYEAYLRGDAPAPTATPIRRAA